VTDAASLEEAEAILADRGITSELAFERRVYEGTGAPQAGER